MKDFTQGSVLKSLIMMALPITFSMLVQTLYFFVDLYFVGRIGDTALAGVSAAGNLMFIVMVFTQVLTVGAVALISQAVGEKNQAKANHVFQQTWTMALIGGVGTLVFGWWLGDRYLLGVGLTDQALQMGRDYFYAMLPSMALQFVFAALAAGLRGTGIVKPAMTIQLLGLVINIALAPICIAGWGTGIAMGTFGAGVATSIAVVVETLILIAYFLKVERYIHFQWRLTAIDVTVWKRILIIGLPAGGEFAFLFVYMAVIYMIVSQFGADAMAGFGVGSRVLQAIFLPGMAVAFSVSAIAGQNVGARNFHRVGEVLRTAIVLELLVMLPLMAICRWEGYRFVELFSEDPQVIAVAVGFLTIISVNFFAQGIVFACSGFFQAMGNTVPSLLSTGSRLITFVLPAFWLAKQTDFQLQQLWYLSVASQVIQAVITFVWARITLSRFLAVGNGRVAVALNT